MKRITCANLIGRSRRLLVPVGGTALLLAVFCLEVGARVGGGQSYGGGGNGGSGGDGAAGAIIWIVFQFVRILFYLTIEYPLIGIPLDLVVVGAVIYFFSRRGKGKSSWSWTFSYGNAAPLPDYLGRPLNTESDVSRAFELLRRFDPNFS
jgi:hypothetical protein